MWPKLDLTVWTATWPLTSCGLDIMEDNSGMDEVLKKIWGWLTQRHTKVVRDTTQISFVWEDLNSRFWPLTELYLCAFTHAPCSFPRNSPKLFGSGLNGPLIDLKISSSGICPLGPCALFPQPFVNSDESQTRISETELEDQESSLLPLRDEDIWSEDSIRQRHARPVISSKVQQMTSEGFPTRQMYSKPRQHRRSLSSNAVKRNQIGMFSRMQLEATRMFCIMRVDRARLQNLLTDACPAHIDHLRRGRQINRELNRWRGAGERVGGPSRSCLFNRLGGQTHRMDLTPAAAESASPALGLCSEAIRAPCQVQTHICYA